MSLEGLSLLAPLRRLLKSHLGILNGREGGGLACAQSNMSHFGRVVLVRTASASRPAVRPAKAAMSCLNFEKYAAEVC